MSAVERLEAAIAKLEAQRDAGTPGPWEASRGYIEGGPFAGNDVTPTEVNCMSYCLGGSPQSMRPEDADLIVMLHRTIEPQLAILREARDLFAERLALRAEMSEQWRAAHHPDPEQMWPADVQPLAIADAILGSES